MESRVGQRWTAGLMVALAMVAVVLGWAIFRFTCDDAYIAFRYVSNHRAGWGFTWNPPPFRPVEGYTSFLWVALLDRVWAWFDVAPPDAANWVSLGCSLLSVLVIAGTVWRIPWSEAYARYRSVWVGLVLIGTVTNRTFLAWTTSGLETALFSMLLLSWVGVALTGEPRGRTVAALAALASAIALCRPDGLLYCAFTVLAGAVVAWQHRSQGWRAFGHLVGFVAFGVPAAHLLWRHHEYGYWLPNTYYAKSTGAWPLGGAVYALSFLLEYFGWIWLWALVRWARAGERGVASGALARVAVGAVAAEAAWYTLVIGGDHFEFRIYHHLVPLGFLSFPWLASRCGLPARRTVALMSAWVLLSWPIPWTHWRLTQPLTTRRDTHIMVKFVSPHLPAVIAPYGLVWDLSQWFLIAHHACMRHQEHKVFAVHQMSQFPPRDAAWLPDQGPVVARAAVDDPAVFEGFSIGVPGWNLPDVAVIDKLGLNDVVVARTPVAAGKFSTMAHDRRPPSGYVACFRPNVTAAKGRRHERPRAIPLLEDEIVSCESRFLSQVTESHTGDGR
jgi:arabinofuranosyltransferase